MRKTSQLHCGACHTNFNDNEALDNHLKSCSAARALLPVAIGLMFNGDDNKHKTSTLFYQSNKNAHLIERYAYCIAYEVSNMERCKVHAELCEKLGLSHLHFKPFESDDIDHLPTVEEAKQIIWRALQREMINSSPGLYYAQN